MAAPLIDYASNLNTKNDKAREKAYHKMVEAFGYLPVYGQTILDVEYGQRLLKYLTNDFPGYKWVIEVRDTIVTVVCETLSPDWGFRLKEKAIDNDGVAIRMMAGGLLERYGAKRGTADKVQLAELPRDARGNIKRTA